MNQATNSVAFILRYNAKLLKAKFCPHAARCAIDVAAYLTSVTLNFLVPDLYLDIGENVYIFWFYLTLAVTPKWNSLNFVSSPFIIVQRDYRDARLRGKSGVFHRMILRNITRAHDSIIFPDIFDIYSEVQWL